jgi:hypothetical protein
MMDSIISLRQPIPAAIFPDSRKVLPCRHTGKTDIFPYSAKSRFNPDIS